MRGSGAGAGLFNLSGVAVLMVTYGRRGVVGLHRSECNLACGSGGGMEARLTNSGQRRAPWLRSADWLHELQRSQVR